MESDELARAMKVLSSEQRLKILELLREGRLCAGAIARRLDSSPSSTSQHLRILRSAGMVKSRRCGNHIHYVLDRPAVSALAEAVGNVLRPGGEQAGSSCPTAETDCRTEGESDHNPNGKEG